MSNNTKQVAAPAVSPAPPVKSAGEKAFEFFCAAIFLGMIGLVFYNAFLRYVFRSSFPPSEEWARFLFTYITFFGGIEAFYRKKHIAVDLVVGLLHGKVRKAVDILAILLALGAMAILLQGGILHVMQTYDTYAVSTGVNMMFVTGTLPVMALCAVLIMLRDLVQAIRKPLSDYEPKPEAAH